MFRRFRVLVSADKCQRFAAATCFYKVNGHPAQRRSKRWVASMHHRSAFAENGTGKRTYKILDRLGLLLGSRLRYRTAELNADAGEWQTCGHKLPCKLTQPGAGRALARIVLPKHALLTPSEATQWLVICTKRVCARDKMSRVPYHGSH